MRAVLLLLSLFLLLPAAQGQVPVSGTLLAEQPCPLYQSIRRGTNPGNWQLTPGESYPLLARNRPDGPWWLVRVKGQTRWVDNGCGQVSLASSAQPGDAGAAAHATTGVPAPSSVEFDYYTLAMSWHSGFCAGASRRPECADPAGELVLHGLWPSNRRGSHPAWCGEAQRRGFCSYPPLSLEETRKAELASVMPGVASCLGRYQWQKHGRCSGLPMETYFELAIRYSQWLRSAPPVKRMQQQAGQTLSRSELLGWFQQWGAQVSLHCRQNRLEEIRLRLKAPLPVQPGLTALDGGVERSRCPEQILLLP
ncbi:ribonuclease T2 family protein [Ferrimonas gelatinilytica]|uniref:Uncharacterized protein n=1 Tax=Ferrimonas gelatinilytica TaxID=1255257 RepID=A0ABP9RXV9_9GAMM